MSSRFFIPSKKWPAAVNEALSHLVNLPQTGDIDEPVFRFGPPSNGRMPLRVLINGRTTLLCDLSDGYPFLGALREWMEHCLCFDRLGDGQPGFVTLDTFQGTCTLILVHAGWERGRDGRPVAVSLFAAVRSGARHPAACCFCRTRRTVGALYRALQESVEDYRGLFDSRDVWYDSGMFSLRDRLKTSGRMKRALRSPLIEMKADYSHEISD